MKLYLFFFFAICCSCNFSTIHSDRVGDKDDAEIIGKEFYSYLMEDQFEKTHTLFVKDFFRKFEKSKLDSLYSKRENEYGAIDSIRLFEWHSRIVEGSYNSSQYILTYDVFRKRLNTRETLRLKKDDDLIRIAEYDTNTPAD